MPVFGPFSHIAILVYIFLDIDNKYEDDNEKTA